MRAQRSTVQNLMVDGQAKYKFDHFLSQPSSFWKMSISEEGARLAITTPIVDHGIERIGHASMVLTKNCHIVNMCMSYQN